MQLTLDMEVSAVFCGFLVFTFQYCFQSMTLLPFIHFENYFAIHKPTEFIAVCFKMLKINELKPQDASVSFPCGWNPHSALQDASRTRREGASFHSIHGSHLFLISQIGE